MDVRLQTRMDDVNVLGRYPRLDDQSLVAWHKIENGLAGPMTPPSVRSFRSTTSPATGALITVRSSRSRAALTSDRN